VDDVIAHAEADAGTAVTADIVDVVGEARLPHDCPPLVDFAMKPLS
jgi:hypothetical protein